jgi:uncharacterized peroxidase-related enzyme
MPFLNHWPESATIFNILIADLDTYRPFCDFMDGIMRGPSSLEVKERELMSAYVSGLNSCQFCTGAHTAAAEAFGVEPGLLKKMLEDLETSGVEEKLIPLLNLARKLTIEHAGSRLTQADVDAIFEAGWDEKAYRDTVAVTAVFALCNRIVHGFGVQAINPDILDKVGAGNMKHGYRKRLELGLADKTESYSRGAYPGATLENQ